MSALTPTPELLSRCGFRRRVIREFHSRTLTQSAPLCHSGRAVVPDETETPIRQPAQAAIERAIDKRIPRTAYYPPFLERPFMVLAGFLALAHRRGVLMSWIRIDN
jgi:hypothetical protein